ncbi:hypothetical protein PhCBS80983_g03974 [Powellomyces hirtus]|uniref:CCHC-type domain-containing protein n=1 Tax=Powellomyces hirtus TaxID=109895 RepID=A0A507E0N7_9FUNG|nr:hypothetical protein PhCBS80983_g03974 [Powellomyces hirtus]
MGPLGMHVQRAATAAEVWGKLKEVHKRKRIANKLYLRCKFLTVVMDYGDGMLEHIKMVKRMAQQLEAIGAKVDSEVIVTTLLYRLLVSFESLIMSLDSRADDLTLEFLTACLLHEETCRSDGENGGRKDGRAFYGRSRISNATVKKAGEPCFYCGEEEHFKKECRKRLAAEQQSSEANQASGHVAFAFSATSSRGGHWIFDSSASQHMTSNRAWLSNLQPLNNARVHLADNRIVEATEKGTATIQTALANGRASTCPLKEGLAFAQTRERSQHPISRKEMRNQDQEGCARSQLRPSGGALCPGTTSGGCCPAPCCCHQHNRSNSGNLASMPGTSQLSERPAHGQDGPGPGHGSSCALGKATKLPFPKDRSSRVSDVLELVHSDVFGPMRTLTIGGARYFILFIDNKSRAAFPYLLKSHFPASRSLLQRLQQRQDADAVWPWCRIPVQNVIKLHFGLPTPAQFCCNTSAEWCCRVHGQNAS